MRLGLVVGLVAIAASSVVGAETRGVEAQDRTLVVTVDGRQAGRLDLPVAPRQVLQRGDSACVALGTAGLWIVNISHAEFPTVVARVAVGQEIVGVVPLQGTQIGAVDSAGAMLVFDIANPAAPKTVSLASPTAHEGSSQPPPPLAPPPAAEAPIPFPEIEAPPPPVAPPPPAQPVPASPIKPASPPPLIGGRMNGSSGYFPSMPPPITGTVVHVVQGSAVLDKGIEDGLTLGAHLEIISQTPVERPNPTTGVLQQAPSNESVAVVAVREVAPHGAVAELNRGDVVHDGDHFIASTLPVTERLTFPKRAPYTQRFAAVLRPFIEVGQLGIGFLGDIRYSYHFDLPVSLDAEAAPVAFEIRSGVGQAFPMSLGLTANYDTDYFAIGLGLGMLTYTQLPFTAVGTTTTQTTTPLTGTSSPSTYAARAAMFLHVRLGSIDGLQLDVRNILVIREDVPDGAQTFHYSGIEVIGYIPLNRRLSLQLGGGGADNGWDYGEIGVRTYFVGNGGPGTVIVPICVGVAAFQGPSVFEPSGGVVGPMASIGVEMRW